MQAGALKMALAVASSHLQQLLGSDVMLLNQLPNTHLVHMHHLRMQQVQTQTAATV